MVAKRNMLQSGLEELLKSGANGFLNLAFQILGMHSDDNAVGVFCDNIIPPPESESAERVIHRCPRVSQLKMPEQIRKAALLRARECVVPVAILERPPSVGFPHADQCFVRRPHIRSAWYPTLVLRQGGPSASGA